MIAILEKPVLHQEPALPSPPPPPFPEAITTMQLSSLNWRLTAMLASRSCCRCSKHRQPAMTALYHHSRIPTGHLLNCFLVGKDCLTAEDPPAGVRHQPLHLKAFWPEQSAHPLAIKLYTGNLLTYLAAGTHSSCAAGPAWEYYLLVYKLHAFTFTLSTVKGCCLLASLQTCSASSHAASWLVCKSNTQQAQHSHASSCMHLTCCVLTGS